MKALKTVLILLLAWTFSVQAMAGVSAVNCRHAGKNIAGAEAPRVEHTAMSMATDAHAVHGAVHANHLKADDANSAQTKKTASASMHGCDCGCRCVSQHCTSSASGLACSPVSGIARIFTDSLRPTREHASPVSAHARDLIRPPSIT